MSPEYRAFLRIVSLSLLAGIISICGAAGAQNPNGPGDGSNAQKAGPKKPTWKTGQVSTSDSVVLLGVKKTPTSQGGAAESKVEVGTTSVTAEDTEKKAAEIASLEKQIQDKTKQIALLMRLFVNDERPFVNDPAHAKTDEETQGRRKYEQDELLYETSELAKLKARLNEITAAKQNRN